MPYVVSRLKPRANKVDLLSFLSDLVTVDMVKPPTVFQTTGTRTAYYDYITPQKRHELRIPEQINALKAFYNTYKHLCVDDNPSYNYELQVELESAHKRSGKTKEEARDLAAQELKEKYDLEYCDLYHTFYIPKRSSTPTQKKWRRIDAPSEELSNALRKLKIMFEALMDGCTYHTSAFAYVQHRCPVDAVRKHAQNKSNWELKLDFSNFFGSVTLDFLLNMLSDIFPFSEITRTLDGHVALKNCLSLCFLNGGLPQGTPISPLLTNIMMIPIDHKISNGLRNHPVKSPHKEATYDYIYTRYADDITVSNRMKFDQHEIVKYIQRVLDYYHAPFSLNPDKTRFGSISGANWQLGVMYNQDYHVTVGHQRKKRLKAALSNYAMDTINHIGWRLEDLQQLQGEIAYCKSVEKDVIEDIINRYSQKYHMDITLVMKQDIKRKSQC